MASMAVTSLLSMTVCLLLLAMTTTSVSSAADRTNDHYCFRHREPIGRIRGKCWDKIRASPANDTVVLNRTECCRLGGSGWSEKSNGKRCLDACLLEPGLPSLEPESPEPTSGARVDPVESLTPTKGSMEGVEVDQPLNDNLTWSEWGSWSNCSVLCGVGNITRSRTCLPGNVTCNSTGIETIQCDTNVTCIVSRPVHGRWTEWGNWSDCDLSDPCNSFQTTTRTCTAPSPLNGGRPCRGTSTRTRPCSRLNCAVGWSAWSEWQPCSTCGEPGGTTRDRVCNGGECPGVFFEVATCLVPC